MKAFVLAGGAGTRLSPLTSYVLKGMIPISGKPFIDYVVEYLSRHGIRNIMMLLSDEDSEVFRNHLEDGSKFGVSIGYNISPRLGTAMALKEAADHVDGTFVVYYGDVLTNMDLAADILPHLLSKGAKFYGFITKEPHHDIGSFKQLDEAKYILKPQKGRAKQSSHT